MNTNTNENNYYHDTELLLKNYRNVKFALETASIGFRKNFETRVGNTIEGLLDQLYCAGYSVDPILQDRANSLAKSEAMLNIVDEAINVIEKCHFKGKEFKKIIELNYIVAQHYSLSEILDILGSNGFIYSERTYYRAKKEAIETLSSVLWGLPEKLIIQ